MKNFRPFIGVTPGYDYGKDTAYVKNGYCEGIIKAGGIPLLVPLTMDEGVLAEVFDKCGGFLLTGGPDIDAKHYGENNLSFNGEISPHRDFMEIFIAKRSIEYNKPVFGICRGIQILNVALGGTLYQDIHSQIKDREVIKHSQDAPKWYPAHDIYIYKNSHVWASFLKDCASVNSFHHQAVKDVAEEFMATSRAPDGIIESIEHVNHPFAVGVQWHPELMWQSDGMFLGLFVKFAGCCK